MKETWLIRPWQRQTTQPCSKGMTSVTAATQAQSVTNTSVYIYILQITFQQVQTGTVQRKSPRVGTCEVFLTYFLFGKQFSHWLFVLQLKKSCLCSSRHQVQLLQNNCNKADLFQLRMCSSWCKLQGTQNSQWKECAVEAPLVKPNETIQVHVRAPWKQPQSTKPSSGPLCALESFKLAPVGLLPLRENRFSTVKPNFGGLISQLI